VQITGLSSEGLVRMISLSRAALSGRIKSDLFKSDIATTPIYRPRISTVLSPVTLSESINSGTKEQDQAKVKIKIRIRIRDKDRIRIRKKYMR